MLIIYYQKYKSCYLKIRTHNANRDERINLFHDMTIILTYMPQELPQSSKHKRAMEMIPKERDELSLVKVQHNLNIQSK